MKRRINRSRKRKLQEKRVKKNLIKEKATSFVAGIIILGTLVVMSSYIPKALNYKPTISNIDETENLTDKVTNSEVKQSNTNLKGVWLRTVYNLDFPKTQGAENQKKEIINIVNNLKKNQITDVFFQVRPHGDALYKSNINPWSKVLTGEQGVDPGYDPLRFLLDEASKYNIKVHAWLNPYRLVVGNDALSNLVESHPVKKVSEMVLYDSSNKPFLNPGSSYTLSHIEKTVEELLINYPDIASIHMDDYFYPEGYVAQFKKDSPLQDKLREDVTKMIEAVKKITSRYNNRFGVSPSGIWKNSSSDKLGSKTSGNESYYSVAADTKLWIDNEYIDYIVPQIYWSSENNLADYEILVEWWSDTVKNSEVDLYIGQGIHSEEVAKEIDYQINFNKQFDNIAGSIFYSYGDMINNLNVTDKINYCFNN